MLNILINKSYINLLILVLQSVVLNYHADRHFIIGGLNYYALTYNTMYLLCSYCIAKHYCCY